MRVDGQLLAGLGVLHDDQPEVGQVDLHRVVQPHRDHFVPPRQLREPPAPAGRADEIRHDEHDRAPLHHRLSAGEQFGEIGHLAGLAALRDDGRSRADGADPVEQVQHMTPAVAGRNDFVPSFGVQHRADAVAVACEQPCQHRDQLGRQHALAHAARPEVDRGRKIEQKPGRNLAILLELAHVRRLQPRGDIPVDVAHVVVQLILAQIGEIEAEAAEQRPVVALQQAVETAQHGPLEAAQQPVGIDAAAPAGRCPWPA